ncbi:GPW/gp25 family protein [Methanosarcina sp. DH1]|uniref:GPW/gp25 family protein n=1 Tax=Methanosarcina sp. DH1 TaxID=2605695 RepID=UPI001E3BD9A1
MPECRTDPSGSAKYCINSGKSEGNIMQIDYPYHINSNGKTADTDDDDHIRDLIEQVLFTSPGERVNRPAFGTGLLQQVFAPNSDELAIAVQFMVQSSLQQWLGDLIQVEGVDVENLDSTLQVTVQYVVRRNQQRMISQFAREV